MHDPKHKQRGNSTTDFTQNNKCQKGKDNQGKHSKKQGKDNQGKCSKKQGKSNEKKGDGIEAFQRKGYRTQKKDQERNRTGFKEKETKVKY